jgi:hypothetical protein
MIVKRFAPHDTFDIFVAIGGLDTASMILPDGCIPAIEQDLSTVFASPQPVRPQYEGWWFARVFAPIDKLVKLSERVSSSFDNGLLEMLFSLRCFDGSAPLLVMLISISS